MIQPGGYLVDLHPLRVERQNALYRLRGLPDLAAAQHDQCALRMYVPCIDAEFPRFVIVEFLVRVEVAVVVVTLASAAADDVDLIDAVRACYMPAITVASFGARLAGLDLVRGVLMWTLSAISRRSRSARSMPSPGPIPPTT